LNLRFTLDLPPRGSRLILLDPVRDDAGHPLAHSYAALRPNSGKQLDSGVRRNDERVQPHGLVDKEGSSAGLSVHRQAGIDSEQAEAALSSRERPSPLLLAEGWDIQFPPGGPADGDEAVTLRGQRLQDWCRLGRERYSGTAVYRHRFTLTGEISAWADSAAAPGPGEDSCGTALASASRSGMAASAAGAGEGSGGTALTSAGRSGVAASAPGGGKVAPGIAKRCGLRYRTAVLDLGDVREAARVLLNGREAGVLLWPLYRLRIEGLLREGENELVVEVTNTLANRFDGEPRPSGLLGPVALQFGR
jgi:hypothetical protein